MTTYVYSDGYNIAMVSGHEGVTSFADGDAIITSKITVHDIHKKPYFRTRRRKRSVADDEEEYAVASVQGPDVADGCQYGRF